MSAQPKVLNKVLFIGDSKSSALLLADGFMSICKHFASERFDQAGRDAPTLTGGENHPREALHSDHFQLLH